MTTHEARAILQASPVAHHLLELAMPARMAYTWQDELSKACIRSDVGAIAGVAAKACPGGEGSVRWPG